VKFDPARRGRPWWKKGMGMSRGGLYEFCGDVLESESLAECSGRLAADSSIMHDLGGIGVENVSCVVVVVMVVVRRRASLGWDGGSWLAIFPARCHLGP
jgi:hypothetical protein